MKRTQLNFAIDVAAFVAFLFLLSTGLLLRYQLPAGSGGRHPGGSGRGAADRSVTLLWGWTRHDWGYIHYWIAGLLVAILAVHVALHWKWIVCVLRGAQGDTSGLRFGIGLASLLALMLLVAAPLLAPLVRLNRHDLQREQSTASSQDHSAAIEIRGSMTLNELAQATNRPVAQLLSELNLPTDVAPNERLGRLLRQHGLQMSDLRQILGADDYVAANEKETEP